MQQQGRAIPLQSPAQFPGKKKDGELIIQQGKLDLLLNALDIKYA